MKSQVTVNFLPDDFAVIEEIASKERRKPADVIRNLIEDIANGTLKIPQETKVKVKKHGTTVRMDEALRSKVDAMKEREEKSLDKIVHLVVQSLR